MSAVTVKKGAEHLREYAVPDAKFFTQTFCDTCGSKMPRLDPGRDIAVIPLGCLDDDPEIVWQNKELRSQMNPAVLVGDHLYGIDGDAGDENALKCLEFSTGEVKWSVKEIGTGGVTAADGKLIVLSSRGELIIAPASAEKFEPIARAPVLSGKC